MPLSVDDVEIPRIYLADSSSKIITDTAVVARAGGIETRRSSLAIGRDEFDLLYRGSSCETVQQLHRTQDGPVRAFLIDDVDENTATEVELQKVTVAGVTVCQLRIVFESLSVYTSAVVRRAFLPVYRVKSGTLVVTVNGSPVTDPADFTEEDGLLTFTSLLDDADEVVASFGFYKVIRFSGDDLFVTWTDDDIRDASCRVISLILPTEVDFTDTAGAIGPGVGIFTADSTFITADDTTHTADED